MLSVILYRAQYNQAGNMTSWPLHESYASGHKGVKAGRGRLPSRSWWHWQINMCRCRLHSALHGGAACGQGVTCREPIDLCILAMSCVPGGGHSPGTMVFFPEVHSLRDKKKPNNNNCGVSCWLSPAPIYEFTFSFVKRLKELHLR